MSGVITRPVVLFDASVVSSLTGHPDDHAFAYVFVSRFRRMLPERVRRVEAALRDEDPKAALDTVLSLTVSSCTLGAGELSALGRRIEDHVRRADYPGARLVAEELPDAARRTDEALEDYLRL